MARLEHFLEGRDVLVVEDGSVLKLGNRHHGRHLNVVLGVTRVDALSSHRVFHLLKHLLLREVHVKLVGLVSQRHVALESDEVEVLLAAVGAVVLLVVQLLRLHPHDN